MEFIVSDELAKTLISGHHDSGGILIVAGSIQALLEKGILRTGLSATPVQHIVVTPGLVFQDKVFSYRIRQSGRADKELWLRPPIVPATYRHQELFQLLASCLSRSGFQSAFVLYTTAPGVPLGVAHQLGQTVKHVQIDPWELVVRLQQQYSVDGLDERQEQLRNLVAELLHLYPVTRPPAASPSQDEIKNLFPGYEVSSEGQPRQTMSLALRKDLRLELRPEFLPTSWSDSAWKHQPNISYPIVSAYARLRRLLRGRADD